MPNQPLLTVIVPVYNVEKYLSKCLDSIINQSYRNLEIICVNDGSPDNCEQILEHYSKLDNRIVVVSTNNGGLSHARNIGLALAQERWRERGHEKTVGAEEFITFVDSDDSLALDAYEYLISKFTSDVDLVSFGYSTVNSIGKQYKTFKPNALAITGMIHVSDEIITCITHSVWSKLFRKNIIFDNNILFPEGVNFEDIYFTTIYLLFAKSIWFDDKAFYYYLTRDDSIMGATILQKPGNVIHFIRIVEALIKYFKDNDFLEKKNNLLLTVIYKCLNQAASYASSYNERVLVYSEAKRVLQCVPSISCNGLFEHYNYLIDNNNFADCVYYKYCRLVKIKHRIEFDKYYILGIPMFKIYYNKCSRMLSIFSILTFKV